jgi:protein transport protein SEC23
MQIRTTYRYPANLSIKFQRITTIRRLFGNFAGDLASGFDQGAALALLAKLSIGRSLSAPSDELRQWLDNILCKWAALFGNYRVGEADSFRLVDNIKLFPQFVYHLRRNSIVRRSGLSLDEVNQL